MKDIYFKKNYGKLYEKYENGNTEVFEYTTSFGSIKHVFIKREIPFPLDNRIYFDLITPYGYGGPLVINCQKGKKSELIDEFKQQFEKYCIDNNIVSEFVRFHPIFKNAIDFKNIYEVEHIRNTVGTNLKLYNDPFQSEFSKSCRKNIRKALKNGIKYRITEKPTDVSNFIKFYYSTMDRNQAGDYYYFDNDYFEKCVYWFRDNLLLVEAVYENEPIAMGLYFIYNKIIHIHLSGTLSEFLYLSPAYILRYAVTEWGKKNGYELIHHGGGRSNSLEDGLYLFKKQFGKNTEFEFHIGKKIWNQDIYGRLCEITNTRNSGYFPDYRSE